MFLALGIHFCMVLCAKFDSNYSKGCKQFYASHVERALD